MSPVVHSDTGLCSRTLASGYWMLVESRWYNTYIKEGRIMSWADALENVNYLSVVLGVVASMVIGIVWYAPQGFGKTWMEMIGFKKKDMEDKSGMPVMMTMSTLFYAIASLAIALLFELIGGSGLGEGAFLGAVVGFAFGLGPLAVTYGFAKRKFELTMIDGGYVVVTMTIIGTIVGYFA